MEIESINPFAQEHDTDVADSALVESAQKGDRDALERLIRRHQAWIYNIALRMVLNPQNAEDVTQEVLIKMITKLSQFQGKSSFRTWLYRIVANHVINMKKKCLEEVITTFQAYGDELDRAPDMDLPDRSSLPVDAQLIVEEAKIGCMMGMLLCLDREQRLIYILGEMFEVSDAVGSEIMEISRDNFRQKLSRARKDMHSFMNEKCGLINHNNPCRCARKTMTWIRAGYVDPHNLKFNARYVKRIKDVSQNKSKEICRLMDEQYAQLFREHPFQNPPDFVQSLRETLRSRQFQQIFSLPD
jgi:RNA polymerase sigma factor (sigma-70 family)